MFKVWSRRGEGEARDCAGVTRRDALRCKKQLFQDTSRL